MLAVVAIAGCGGGGGSGSEPSKVPRLSVSATTVSVSAVPGDLAPGHTLNITVSNPPAEGIFLDGTFTNRGVESVLASSLNSPTATAQVTFRKPGSLVNGTYTDTLTLRACLDSACATQVAGSPVTITTTYTVSGTGPATVTSDRTSVSVTAYNGETAWRVEAVKLTLSSAPASGFYVSSSVAPGAAVWGIGRANVTPTSHDVVMQFKAASDLPVGTYSDTVTIRVCYDTSCVRQAAGSPVEVSARLSVVPNPALDLPPLAVQSRRALLHNVVDAEFSLALNQLVMVATYPRNALYIYDVATETEREQVLTKPPKAVSIAPDGLTAAVGHDALISVVNLGMVGKADSTSPTLLNVSTDVFDVVLDGNRVVHVFPDASTWTQVRSVDIATNTERVGTGQLYGRARARLHPSGSHVYAADMGVSPDDIHKFDVSSGVASRLYDSSYHGEYRMCGNVWFNVTGASIYTACGNSFRSSTERAEDITYTGRLTLSTFDYLEFRIDSLNHSPAAVELSLIESSVATCTTSSGGPRCYSRLASYESEFLQRKSVYTIPSVDVGGTSYAQRGLFVFYDTSGSRRFLISRLTAMPNPDTEYYLSVVQ